MDLLQKSDARNIALLHENTNAIKGLATRVDSLESKFEKHSADYKAEISAVRQDVAIVTAANVAQEQRNTLDNPREIIVGGIPASTALTSRQIANALLSALELSHLASLVVGWREWTPKPRTVRGEQPEVNQATQTIDQPSAAASTSTSRPRAVVLKLACPSTRDHILMMTPNLRNIDCQSIFGVGGDSKLSVTALWPGPVFKLLRRTFDVSKTLNYERPILSVFCQFIVRPTLMRF